MSAIEESLRRALARGNASDPEFRVRIYEASERALERLADERAVGEEAGSAQREALIAAIAAIEAEYTALLQGGDGIGEISRGPADEGMPPIEAGLEEHGPLAPAPIGPSGDSREPRAYAADLAQPETSGDVVFHEPPVVHDREASDGIASVDAWPSVAGAAPGAELPRIDRSDGSWTSGSVDRRAPRNDRRTRGIGFWIGAILGILGLLAAGYLVYVSLLSNAPAERSAASAPAPELPPASPEAAPSPPAEEEWIEVFSGTTLETISTPGGGQVNAISEAGGQPAVRIMAPADDESAQILFAVGPGILGQTAGQTVRVEIEAGTPDDQPREFAVRCVFGDESPCERQRFSTSTARDAFVFDVAVPASVGETASIAIQPGIGGAGSDIDIYSIRLRPLD